MKQTLKYIYGIIDDNMKYAESKHSIILTLSGAVIAFASTFFTEGNLFQNLFAIASILFALIAILYSFVALTARKVRIRQKRVKKDINLIYYKDIMRFDEKGYITQIKKEYGFTSLYKPDKMDFDLAKEIIATSKVAWLKFFYFNFAVFFLVVSISSIIVAVLIRGKVW